ncbi:MAG: methyltransferase domain-containing protein [Anaerolineae bacterium]
MSKKRVQEQFGAHAAGYVASPIHAKGASLARLVALTQPQPHWLALDVATSAGHTALTFAPHVSHVVATDITPQMLLLAGKLAGEQGVGDLSLGAADAEALPFADRSFDLVTCRIAAHHFPDVGRFLAESARVLRPDGILAVVDNIVPGSHLRGKKARRQRDAGRYVNAFEKLRDPSHHRCLSLDEWTRAFHEAGFTNVTQETAYKQMAFEPWAERMGVSADNKVRLRAMLLQAPEPAAEFLLPQGAGTNLSFRLTEAIIVGRKPSAARP